MIVDTGFEMAADMAHVAARAASRSDPPLPPHRSDSHRKVALAGIENKPELKGLDLSKFEGAPVEAMQEALRYIRRYYGSPQRYMSGIGFGVEKQARLAELMLSETWRPLYKV